MINKMKGNISSKQAMLLIISAIFPNILWGFPNSSATIAKQAGWLAPIPALLVFLYIIKQFNYLIIKNPNLSLLENFEKCTNKIVGKTFAGILLFYNIYYFTIIITFITERFVGSIYPNVKSEIFIISILIILSLILKSNISVVSRMNEIIIILIMSISFIIIALLFPNISVEKITPISYIDIVPTIKASFSLISSFGTSVIYILILTNKKIIDKRNLNKYGKKICFIIFSLSILFLIVSIGVFGYYSLTNIPYSFMTIIQKLNLLNFLSGFDSIFITIWVISEIIVLNVFILSFFEILKYLFNIKHITNFINIILISIFILSKLITKNFYMLIEINQQLFALVQIFANVIIPIIFIWIYKLRFEKKRLK